MPNSPTILAFSGSPSRRSLNDKVVRVAMQGASAAGANVRHVHLADYPMPVFNVDDEDVSGMPENAKAFKTLMIEHDGFLLSTPEYNGTLTGAFKNVIDWMSRISDGRGAKVAFEGKYIAILSASPGVFGAVRSLDHTRYVLGRLGMTVIPANFPVSSADKMFDADGNITDDRAAEAMRAVGRALAETLKTVGLSRIGAD